MGVYVRDVECCGDMGELVSIASSPSSPPARKLNSTSKDSSPIPPNADFEGDEGYGAVISVG